MMGPNIGFKGAIWKIIPKLSLLPLLIWSTVLTFEILMEVLTNDVVSFEQWGPGVQGLT